MDGSEEAYGRPGRQQHGPPRRPPRPPYQANSPTSAPRHRTDTALRSRDQLHPHRATACARGFLDHLAEALRQREWLYQLTTDITQPRPAP
ncbi:hypothetical protein AB0F17_20955 [Nonomuraea sp. NPDC026600]|uniref:hypothetical protein n=1 Tax=Nonomuraea sp. NPDC026600 TaxID=3155363 RepID=UPI0033E9BA7C